MDCWDFKKCADEYRNGCPAYVEKKGLECWKLTGTMCDAGRLKLASIEEKMRFCKDCEFYKKHAKRY